MDMQGPDRERRVHTETTACQPIDIVIRITRDPHDPARKVVTIAVGDSPPAVLRLSGDVGNGTAVIEAIRKGLADLMNIDKIGGV